MKIELKDLTGYIAAKLGPRGLLESLKIPYEAVGVTDAKIHCLVHSESTPSMSVRVGDRGTVIAHCFGCDTNLDAIDMVAKVRGEEGAPFPKQVETAAILTGFVDSEGGLVETAPVQPVVIPAKGYPATSELRDFWSVGTQEFEAAADVLPAYRDLGRGIATIIDGHNANLPKWWPYSGRYLTVKCYSPDGEWVSVHGRNLRQDATPKTVFPKGHSASATFFANASGHELLKSRTTSSRHRLVFITEGLTDTLSLACHAHRREGEGEAVLRGHEGWDHSVIGVHAGSLKGLDMVNWPGGSRVKYFICTDNDETGERYADAIRNALPECRKIVNLKL